MRGRAGLPEIKEPAELMIATSVESSRAIMREIDKIHRWQMYRKLMPAIAKVLMDAGVDFSRATIPSEAEVEASIEQAMRAEQ